MLGRNRTVTSANGAANGDKPAKPAAAKVLAVMLDKLATASAGGRRGRLSVIKSMTEKGGA